MFSLLIKGLWRAG